MTTTKRTSSSLSPSWRDCGLVRQWRGERQRHEVADASITSEPQPTRVPYLRVIRATGQRVYGARIAQ